MNPIVCSAFAATFFIAISTTTRADSLSCGQDIVSSSATEKELLDACGQPTSVNGTVWTYEVTGSFPRKLSFENSVLMFIDLGEDPALADKPNPYGDRL